MLRYTCCSFMRNNLVFLLFGHIKVETELKEKMLTSLRTDYKYYYYHHNDPISTGWNDMFMEVNYMHEQAQVRTHLKRQRLKVSDA